MKSEFSLKQVRAIAASYDVGVRADDKRLRGSVQIIHEEGTVLFYNYAFVMKFYDWFVVFTEHHGHHVYHESDLYRITQLKITGYEFEKLEAK